MSRFTHYTDRPTVLDRDRRYDPRGFHRHKPNGLWVSVDGDMDWPEWCLSEGFRTAGLTYAYRVTLVPSHNLLVVTNGRDLESLHADYSEEDDFNRRYRDDPYFSLESLEFRRNQWPMNWTRLAADYQGLIIAPYLWSHRLDGPFWYYGFDCASGCIWDLDAVDTFTPRRIPALKAARRDC